MFHLLMWILFGLFVGFFAKIIHPGPIGFVSTVLVGVCGSFVGGLINYLIGMGSHPFAPSGFFMSIVGGVLCCVAWRYYNLKNSPDGPKSFFTGKNIK
jgi:uncharacterized membrane protein YeaQ/YmgE (transglycosylase-associated protein family)